MIKGFLSLSLLLLLAATVPTSYSNTLDSSSLNIDQLISTLYAKQHLNSAPEINISPPFRCWLCTLITNALMEFTIINNLKIDDFIMKEFCKMFPTELKPTCQNLIGSYGPAVIIALLNSASPDAACRAIKLCNMPQCTLIPPRRDSPLHFSDNWAQYLQIEDPSQQFTPASDFDGASFMFQSYQTIIKDSVKRGSPIVTDSVADWFSKLENESQSPIDWLVGLIKDITINHIPPVDFDGDKFSELSPELRGYNWRGRDCNDNNANVYPGRKKNSGLPTDYNCNGISGVDHVTGKAYKDLFCENTTQLGVVVMGDSAGAHAEIPTQWVNGSQWNASTFKDLIRTLTNEVDLPHMSGYTGYADTGYTGPVSSVYKHFVQRNKCNHRDYQNIAVNGLKSTNGMTAFPKLARDKDNDHPLLIFLELVGNDVCGKEEDSANWTTPAHFRENIVKILDYLDTVVPPGSHLVTLGLANGSLIYEAVNGRMHPSGVTYNKLYDFQNCLVASMCWGWLNTNQTIRDATTQRAYELNQVYRDIFSTYQAKNFDFIYYDFPAQEIFDQYLSEGKDVYELVEPVDGFHPSQIFHARLGDWLWNSLMNDHPEWLGEENPNNDRITQLFGDQGGY